MSTPSRPVFDVADLDPPTHLGTSELAVSSADIERYGDSFPADVRDAMGDPIMLFDHETVRLIARQWAHGSAVQTRARWVVARRVTAGERIVTRVDLTSIVVRHGLARVSSDAVSMIGNEVVGLVTMEHATPPANPSPTPAPYRASAAVGPAAWSYTWNPTVAQLAAFSGRMEPVRNIHTDRKLARSAGFRTVVVQGHHTLALGLQLLVQRLSYAGPIESLARFTGSWHVDDNALIEAYAADDNPDLWRLVVSVGQVPVALMDVTLGEGAKRAVMAIPGQASSSTD